MNLKSLALVGIFVCLQACASGKTTVLAPASFDERATSIKIVAADDTVDVENELATYFETALREELYAEDQYWLIKSEYFLQADQLTKIQKWFSQEKLDETTIQDWPQWQWAKKKKSFHTTQPIDAVQWFAQFVD